MSSAITAVAASQVWVVVGAGLTGMSCIRRLSAVVREGVTIRESSKRVGGRTTSTAQAVTPVSTETSPWEFGAWAYRPFAHPEVSALLSELDVASVSIELATQSTFIWTRDGKKPYGVLPPPPAVPTLDNGNGNNSDNDQVTWFAHTGVWPRDVPRVDVAVLRDMDMPKTALLPVGFGWQDVVLRGIGTVPVLYGRLLCRVDVLPATSQRRIKLTYASGNTEDVDGAILTLPPPAMAALDNLPRAVTACIADAFTTASAGVLYATWTSMDVWWLKAGFLNGVVASYLPIGRVCVTAPNDLRCVMSGATDVQYWNDLFVSKGERATASAVAQQMSETFGVAVPLPANVSFKGWMNAASLWTTGTDRVAARRLLTRPWGPDVPVWWACSDLSDEPAWAQGAVSAGATVARDVSEFVSDYALRATRL